ncbi:MAG: DUF4403 family protein [Acidobacteria bacterium]|nr:DUF4403 family protein [Acidobacteriota bacterium]
MLRASLVFLLLQAPLPAQAPALAQEADPGPSVLACPIRIALDPVFQEVERLAPRVPPGVETWTALPGPPHGAAFRFWMEREKLRFTVRDNQIGVRTDARYWLEVGARVAGGWHQTVGGCGRGAEGLRSVLLQVRAELAPTPDWGLEIRTWAEAPLPSNPCLITFLGYDITGQVTAGMRAELLKAAASMERTVRESALVRQQAEAFWRAAQAPQELAPGIHLLLNPERIRFAPIRSEGRQLVLTPEIQARPGIVLGAPASTPLLPLPPLETGAAVQPGFRVRVDLDLPFQEATRQLRSQVAGREFETEQGRFGILDASVRAEGGKLVLEVQLQGRLEGRLALAGRPVFDEARELLRVEDLDYTLESRGWITRAGAWLFRSSLRRTLQEKADWFLGQRLGEIREALRLGLNRDLLPGVGLRGEVGTLRLAQPRLLEDRVQVQASLEGFVELAVRDLGALPRR